MKGGSVAEDKSKVSESLSPMYCTKNCALRMGVTRTQSSSFGIAQSNQIRVNGGDGHRNIKSGSCRPCVGVVAGVRDFLVPHHGSSTYSLFLETSYRQLTAVHLESGSCWNPGR